MSLCVCFFFVVRKEVKKKDTKEKKIALYRVIPNTHRSDVGCLSPSVAGALKHSVIPVI